MAPRVWVAAAGEAGVVARLMVEFRDWNGKSSPDDKAFSAGVERLIAREDTEFLLGANGDGAASGVCQLRFRPSLWTGSDDCWLEDLYVREEARGSGLGGALVEAALERARGRGCGRVELDTNAGNPARRLYERLGFSARSKGGSEDDLFMGRRL